jgi:hypothetical protein
VCDQGDGLITVDQCKTVTFFGREIPTSNMSRGGEYEPDFTNPGLVNVCDQGDGLVIVDQTTSATFSGPVVQVATAELGGGNGAGGFMIIIEYI